MSAPKVVKEFLQCHIAPLQRHSRRVWDFAGHRDRMRLQEEDLAPEALRTMLRVLTSDPSPGSLRSNGVLLYLCSGRADFVRQMPSFDAWGLRPAGFLGRQGGRREPAGVEATDVEVPTPREVLNGASRGLP